MSFILDALRKSEHERERRALPGLVEAPLSRSSRPLLRWVVAGFAALLVVNLAVLGYVLWRPSPVAASAPRAVAPEPAAAPAPRGVVPDVRPLSSEANADDPGETLDLPPVPMKSEAPAAVAETMPANARPAATPAAPLLRQLPAAVAGALPPLNLDLHVYSPVAAQRFVIINGQRLREGGTLREGMQVEAITPTGVVLTHQGTRFMLSHD
jgi:general secretion pathway protein B